MVTFRSVVVFALAHLCHQHSVQAVSPGQIVHDLQDLLSAGSEVVLTSDAAYGHNFTARFAVSHSPGYVVGAKPKLVSDVQKVVQYASKHKVPFLTTGGGHGYTWSLGRLKQGIHLDLGNFQFIHVDKDANTMTIGGGVRMGNVTRDLHALGREFPVGMCPTVGVSGFSLGGGIGPLGGLHGTASDNLLSAEVVTGKGEILTVSANQHPDLFYGLRGAGFNYVVATSLTFRIHPATNHGQVTVINAVFPASLNGSVWKAASSFVNHHPKELAILFGIRFNETLGGMGMVGAFVYFGPRDKALKLVKPFLDLNPLDVEVNDSTYAKFSSVALYGVVDIINSQRAINFAPYTVNLYKIDIKNMIAVMNYVNTTLTQNVDLRSATLEWTQYSPYGFRRHAVESSAYPYRDALVFFAIDNFPPSGDKLPLLDNFSKGVRTLVQRGSGKPNLEAYVHFGHGDEGAAAWYTEAKLPRLRALKRAYDPYGLFTWYNPVTSDGSALEKA